MSSLKILITGGSGLLGQYLNRELSRTNDILTLYFSNEGNCKNFNSKKADITSGEELESIFREFNPDAVVHTAAVTKVSEADHMPSKLVYSINVDATKAIAEKCSEYGSRLIYTSTDLVYGGYRSSILKEDAKLVPISLYAETKLMGEVKIREVFNNFVILRVGLLYGFGLHHSRNQFHNMYLNLSAGKPVDLFTDQFRSPLELSDAARMIGKIINKGAAHGVINFGGKERVSRYRLGEMLCEETGLDKKLLNKISMDEVKNIYKVEDVSMSIEKLSSLGIQPFGIRESIRKAMKEIKS